MTVTRKRPNKKGDTTTMKKLLSLIITLMIVIAMVFAFAVTAYADNGTAVAQQPGYVVGLIDKAATIVQTLVLTAIGILGTWVSLKLNASAKLKNVGAAWDEAVKAARITVGELKQTVVDDLKAANNDGKLTKEEIAQLRETLFEKTKDKMSQPAYDILMAAGVDLNSLILGAGDAFIDEIKRDTYTLIEGVALTTE